GLASTYPGKISVTFDESELGRSAVGTAVRTGTTIIKSSIDKSLEYSPWKNMIDSYGLKSAISLPLKIEGETIGALNIYSSDENAFDQEEVHLLEELSGDLSYGILSLRNRKKLEHLNRVLLSIRSINQLIVREEDRGTLIRKITDLLAGLRSYDKSLLVILDENMKVVDWSSSGFEGAKLEKVETALRENLLPPFLTRVLTSEEVLMIPNEEYRRSNLSGDDQTGHAVLLKSLKSSDRISGFIAAIMPENFSQDLEERSLFGEIANDIALAISKIELKNERESLQERFALFMDKFPGAVFMQDRDLRLSYFNKYMEKYFGIDSHWLGKSADQFLSGEWGRSMLRDARKVRPGESISEELTARCTDGRDRIFFVQKFPISSGSDTSMIGGIALDITNRKLSEIMATRLGRVLDWSVNEIFVFDHETLRFLLANRGAIENTGYSMDELKEMTPLDLKKETSPAEFKKIIDYLKKGENRSVVFETVHTRKNGSKYPVEVRLQLHDDNMGKVFVAVIVDITERKKAEDSVRRSLESLIKTLSVLVESRDPYTYGHQ
ncbi:MAG TPA: PAS domain S-box protein, partial [Mesotoga sp.]|nr:PAS domain S-box protein [Mesotoga sp.]